MRRAVLLTLLPIAMLVNCGMWGGETAPDGGCAVSSTPPPSPTLQHLESWDGRSNFFPTSIQSAYTIYIQSPTSRTRFRAYGIDVIGRTIAFVVEGANDQQQSFVIQMGREFGVFAAGAPDSARYTGGLGQVPNGPPPTPDGPGGDDWYTSQAWKAAEGYHGVIVGLYGPPLTSP